MVPEKQITLVGNNLAILVAADTLAKRNIPVTVVTDGRRMGGHFRGFSIEGYDFDAGAVYLERLDVDRAKVEPPLSTYNPRERYDWLRFAGAVANWTYEQAECVPMPAPKTWLDGRAVPDYLFTTRLDAFNGAIDCKPNMPVDPAKHASQKRVGKAYDIMLYSEAALLNHGPIHARFINPFLDKLMAGTGKDFLARHHRNMWAPLFYPETLCAAIDGQQNLLPEAPLCTTRKGSVGSIARQMVAFTEANPLVTYVSSPIVSLDFKDNWQITLDDGHRINGEIAAFGLSNERLAGLLDIALHPEPESINVNILFATINAESIKTPHSVVHVADPSFKAYRIYDQDFAAGLNPPQHRITVEANAALFAGQDAQEILRQEAAMVYGAAQPELDIRILKCAQIKNVLPLPTQSYLHDITELSETLLERAPGSIMTGSHSGFGVATISDQILQGLLIADSVRP